MEDITPEQPDPALGELVTLIMGANGCLTLGTDLLVFTLDLDFKLDFEFSFCIFSELRLDLEFSLCSIFIDFKLDFEFSLSSLMTPEVLRSSIPLMA